MEKIIKKGITIGIVLGSIFGIVESVSAEAIITGVGTDTLTITSSFSEYDRIINYVAPYSNSAFGPVNPINTSPTNLDASSYSGITSESEPVNFIETNTGCGGVPLDYDECLATGQAVGTGYYVNSGIWFEFEEPILGCTDPDANNYDPDATEDDGSCEYDVPIDPDISEASEKEIFYTVYVLIISVASGMLCGLVALIFYASLAIIRSRD